MKWRNSWVGPGKFIQEISNTEAQIELNGEKLYVHYNRLRKFKPWDDYFLISDTKEEKDSFLEEGARRKRAPRQRALEDIARDEPGVGDLIVMLFEPDPIFNADFGIGEILQVRNDPKDAYHIHWYGNTTMRKTGDFKPGYYDPKDNKIFFKKKQKNSIHIYDSVVTETKIKRKRLVHWGSDLLDKDKKLTAYTLEKMESAREAFRAKNGGA
jgi:hypothetical protein